MSRRVITAPIVLLAVAGSVAAGCGDEAREAVRSVTASSIWLRASSSSFERS